MWEMLEDINFECDECGGPGPPPKFMIPPPPRPPFMQELIKCKDDEISGSSNNRFSGGASSSSNSNSGSISSSNSDINYINNWDSDICDAIPILDASYHSSPSLQTSAIIAVFSLLLVLVVLVSSLFVWKHKRKVQNFLPCKTPTRGPHIGGNISGGHSVTYEDPDAHLGHRPLVMRHHHNVEIMHPSKAIHYPSGYPMTRSPPLFVCSSPGPDPYRSNDNVYEELGPTHDSDIESDHGQQSDDDDFAEDELSLPGDRITFNKSSPPDPTIQQSSVSTIYHERIPSTNLHERNTLLTTTVHSEPNRNIITKNNRSNIITTSNNNNNNINCNISSNSGSSNNGGILSGVFRHTTGRNKNLIIPNCKINNRNNKYQNHNTLPYNIDSGCGNINSNILISSSDRSIINNNQQSSSDILPSQIYDDPNSRNSLMTLAYNSNKNSSNNINNNNYQINGNTSNNNINNNNNNININSGNNNRQQSQNCYNTLENDVERRNRINNQLHQPPLITKLQQQPPVATIFRGNDRINNYTSRYPQPYYTHHQDLINNQSNQQQQQYSRSRTNPRSLDRRRIITSASSTTPPSLPPSSNQIDDTTYGYAEPVFHEGLLYNHHNNNNTLNSSTNNTILRQAYPSYILPDYTTGIYKTLGNNNNNHNHHQHNHHHHNHLHQQLYHYPLICNQDLLQTQQQQNQIQPQSSLYSRDSSFGSDSGYSHNTQGSSLTGDIIGGSNNGVSRGNCRNIINSVRTPIIETSTKYQHGQQNSNNKNCNMNNSSNILWNRKIPHSISSLSSQSTNNSISSSSNCYNKDNNLLSQGINITNTNSNETTPTTNDCDDSIVSDIGILVVNSEQDSKNNINNIIDQSNNSPNNNNLNINNQKIMSNTSKNNSNTSLGSINNNTNLNCHSVSSNGGNSSSAAGIVTGISNSTNNKT